MHNFNMMNLSGHFTAVIAFGERQKHSAYETIITYLEVYELMGNPFIKLSPSKHQVNYKGQISLL